MVLMENWHFNARPFISCQPWCLFIFALAVQSKHSASAKHHSQLSTP